MCKKNCSLEVFLVCFEEDLMHNREKENNFATRLAKIKIT